MAHLAKSPLPVLKKLSTSLTSLDTVLHPLLHGHSLEELTNSLQFGDEASQSRGKEKEGETELSGRLDSARLQVSLAYVVLDLVWIYLKAKGINASSHPVMAELERVKGYFGKIKAVQSRDTDEAHMRLDKSAAGRFIRAALSGNDSEPSSPAGKHTKFDDNDNDDDDEEVASQLQVSATPSSSSAKKERRPTDPFEGYEKPQTPAKRKIDEPASTSTPASDKSAAAEQQATPSAAGSAHKKRKKRAKK
ncbi:uncharacterized protein PFL1_03263 [Pseudozyma flocculosa PF-1]|uniref:Exosome complex protein n=2 Tax=Pseudozyma flocculosa TaxID=84751 RepID=A0A5C3F7C8_9BASI|nr:uncharacterized protein PFL1_03263 [Pseudozyma flocculosa PF-1]EPQ28973.1 hypothetical protein PFL1_03263 [Pseudozyma flocculosa PF-1]SPO39966.1 related to LRP1 - nuclear exosome-associated nucleic acid binding protein [Pseudozyma flocculosa]